MTTRSKTTLSSRVYDIQVLNSAAGLAIDLNVPLTTQPEVRVVDSNGMPLANRSVVVWSSEVANIYRAAAPKLVNFGGLDLQCVTTPPKTTVLSTLFARLLACSSCP